MLESTYYRHDIGEDEMVRVMKRCMDEERWIRFHFMKDDSRVLDVPFILKPEPDPEDAETYDGSLFTRSVDKRYFMTRAIREIRILT